MRGWLKDSDVCFGAAPALLRSVGRPLHGRFRRSPSSVPSNSYADAGWGSGVWVAGIGVVIGGRLKIGWAGGS